MEFITTIMYILIPLYGIAAFFQRSAVARFIASAVMTVALVLHSCVMTLTLAAGATVFGAAWFMTSASGNTTEADVAAVQEWGGADIAGGTMPLFVFLCVFALLLLGFAIAHLIIGLRLRGKQKLKPKPVSQTNATIGIS